MPKKNEEKEKESTELVEGPVDAWEEIVSQATGEKMSLITAILPKSFGEMWKLAHLYSSLGNSIPESCRRNPAEIFARIELGASVGFTPIQALSGIMNVNGRYSLYGDHAIGVCRRNPAWDGIKEWSTGTQFEDNYTHHCIVKRKGEEPGVGSFSVADAKRAGLWEKSGPWTKTPQRQLQFRARGWPLRDKFSDSLVGLSLFEEAIDIVQVQSTAPAAVLLTEGTHSYSNQPPKPVEVIEAKAKEDPPAEAPDPEETTPKIEEPPEEDTRTDAEKIKALKKNKKQRELWGIVIEACENAKCRADLDAVGEMLELKALTQKYQAAIAKEIKNRWPKLPAVVATPGDKSQKDLGFG